MDQSSNSGISLAKSVPKDIIGQNLIREIRKRQGIWNYTGGSVEFLWEEISHELNVPAIQLRRKWAGLRKSFRNQLKKIPRNDENEYMVNPREVASNWPHYQSMMFIVDKIQLAPIEVAVKRETLSSSSNNKRRFDSESKDDDDFEIPLASIKKKKQSENIVVNNQTVTKISNLNSSVFQEGDYAARNIVDSNLSGRSEVAEEIEVIPDLVPMELGSDYHYLMSICHFMNKVKDERKIHVRMKILELLCEELSQEF